MDEKQKRNRLGRQESTALAQPEERTIHDYCKQGDIEGVERCLANDRDAVHTRDSSEVSVHLIRVDYQYIEYSVSIKKKLKNGSF